MHPPLSALLLLTELRDVTNWHLLGVYLRVPQSILTDIETFYQQSEGPDRCKVETLRVWLQRNPDASWKELVDALRQIDEKALATRLENKYCQPSSTQNGNQIQFIGSTADLVCSVFILSLSLSLSLAGYYWLIFTWEAIR